MEFEAFCRARATSKADLSKWKSEVYRNLVAKRGPWRLGRIMFNWKFSYTSGWLFEISDHAFRDLFNHIDRNPSLFQDRLNSLFTIWACFTTAKFYSEISSSLLLQFQFLLIFINKFLYFWVKNLFVNVIKILKNNHKLFSKKIIKN